MNDLILLGLCLWACVATGLALYYFKRYFVLKIVCIGLGKDIVQLARGELHIEITDNEVKRTYKGQTNG